jgi:kynurenine 3-monooxygenase
MNKHIAIIGAGPVGSLLSIYLKKRGYQVSVFERRPDMRHKASYSGRSINIALSNRGLKALSEVELIDKVMQNTVPMYGRTIHPLDGKLNFQPYGKDGQSINSISRNELTNLLINKGEELGVCFNFSKPVLKIDFESTRLTFQDEADSIAKQFDIIIGADGTFSSTRSTMQSTESSSCINSLDYKYKEFCIPPELNNTFKIEKNTLHIWPRKNFMMIALPNTDGSFTCTLFLPVIGNPSFNTLKSKNDVDGFFKNNFPDSIRLMPNLLNEFFMHEPSNLIHVQCDTWEKNKILLIGDAAHTILPFYGQGLNAGFEDCIVLNKLLDQGQDDWTEVFRSFSFIRKPDTDAIAKLALNNFIEMRDLVMDQKFILRKKIEARIHALFPTKWIPLYSMVTFHEYIRYSQAYEIGEEQKKVMDIVMETNNIENIWESLDYESIANRIRCNS